MSKPLGAKPLGVITRGTTGRNRLRRSDRWLVHHP
ncbi:class I SAM-dependent methyltransferase, partial [Mycolicibacterium insubricum]|nr:class I SAM-dependent methyltransferase [Mycolicibacterium insubricum]